MSVIIYPAYFNTYYSRREGRRVPKNLAFEPKLETLIHALNSLGYKFDVEKEKRYPKCWWKDKGRIIVHTEEPKNEVIKKIARKVKNL